ncbi:MAG: class I ribonucleotide reductase maintenance protein YfaE [Vibrio sp.]
MATVKINKQLVIESNTSDTLLETMEKAGLEPEYNCRDGHCGACRCKLISGSVEYVGFAMAFLQPGEVLPCISKAKTALQLDEVNYQPSSKFA